MKEMGSNNKKSASNEIPNGTRNRVFGAGNKVITDERFKLAEKDPRFQDVLKHKNKVSIDSRFSRMFTDKNFSTSSARVDKRGRAKQDADSSQNALKQYYRIDEDDEKKPKKRQESSSELDDDIEELKNVRDKLFESKLEEEVDDEEEEKENEEEEEESTDTDTDEDDEVYLEEETDVSKPEDVAIIGKETHRLAVVKLDWNQVQAVDLFVVFSSFLPKAGQILSVSVYPTEFGLERMEKEAVHGPVGLFNDENGKSTKDDDSDDDDNEIDIEKLRAYELSRLRYYFAEVVCDSIATADYIYKSCDGIEFERSSNKLDLRFIPDSMEFKQPVRDVATEVSANYEGIDFQTRALQLSKIDLTWDENEPQRSKKLKRKINVDQESEYVKDELELKEFIASSESESDEDCNTGNKKRQKTDAYRALVQSRGDDSDEEDDNANNLEVTFNTGLEDISKKILEKKDNKSETVWDAHLRKQKEKKKSRKNRSKDSSDDENGSSEIGDFFAGDSTKKKKVSCKKPEMTGEEVGEASRAELELLLAENDGGDAANNVKGYNMKHNKSKGKKKGKRDDIDEDKKIPNVDYYDDPRFSSLYNNPKYVLDPTDPQFKRSVAYERQKAHKQHKGDVNDHNDSPVEAQASEVDKVDPSKKDKHEMSMLTKSLKMKSKQLRLPSDAKKSRRKGK